jgi:hypothetical protein
MHDAGGRGLQESWGARTLVVPAVVHDGILGISGCVVDLRPRSSSRRFAGKLAAGHCARHGDVGEQGVDRLTAFQIGKYRGAIGDPIVLQPRPCDRAITKQRTSGSALAAVINLPNRSETSQYP